MQEGKPLGAMTKGLFITLSNLSKTTKKRPASQQLSPGTVILVEQEGTE